MPSTLAVNIRAFDEALIYREQRKEKGMTGRNILKGGLVIFWGDLKKWQGNSNEPGAMTLLNVLPCSHFASP